MFFRFPFHEKLTLRIAAAMGCSPAGNLVWHPVRLNSDGKRLEQLNYGGASAKQITGLVSYCLRGGGGGSFGLCVQPNSPWRTGASLAFGTNGLVAGDGGDLWSGVCAVGMALAFG